MKKATLTASALARQVTPVICCIVEVWRGSVMGSHSLLFREFLKRCVVTVDHVARLPQGVGVVAADGVVASHGLLVAYSAGSAEVSAERLFSGRGAAWHEECSPHVLCECPEPGKCAS